MLGARNVHANHRSLTHIKESLRQVAIFTPNERQETSMFRLASMLYSIIGTSIAGIFVIAALASGNDTLQPILIAVAAGALVAIPASYLIAKAILSNR